MIGADLLSEAMDDGRDQGLVINRHRHRLAYLNMGGQHGVFEVEEQYQGVRTRGTPDERIVWLKRFWYRMPLYARPLLYFVYRYFFRRGFLDGKQGFIFHFLQSFWYRLLVDIRLDDLRSQARSGTATRV